MRSCWRGWGRVGWRGCRRCRRLRLGWWLIRWWCRGRGRTGRRREAGGSTRTGWLGIEGDGQTGCILPKLSLLFLLITILPSIHCPLMYPCIYFEEIESKSLPAHSRSEDDCFFFCVSEFLSCLSFLRFLSFRVLGFLDFNVSEIWGVRGRGLRISADIRYKPRS
ncbi:hypothetical protein GYMLUDRAFT_599671 [Collybiopsis luxurians FD-317 M1]|uniref:Uncharacterized protein n=1 Tax=Collybiopsis luxurians FD-317 M1 TaxID=944289 RepID=A0A0D0CXM4_9AGAR|nr:hypothetical protein GYMLUDRAFT_599671 [Collybiopsis luxurians FD-317 M1]